MPPTLRDIAEATQTSVSTVSRVLAGGAKAANMASNTRQRILEVAQRLNYQPNLAARALRLQRSHTIALVCRMSSPVYSRIAHLIDHRFYARDYWLMYCDSNEDPTREAKFLRELVQRGIDGAIIVPTGADAAQIKTNLPDGYPIVMLQRHVEGLGPTVASDMHQGAALLCQTLENAGARRIALITGPASVYNQHVQAQEMERRMSVVWRFEGPLLKKTGRHAYQMLMRQDGLQFDAIVCTAAIHAHGLLQAMPSIVSSGRTPILAVDDSMPFMHLLPIPIVCVVRNLTALANGCVNTLLALLENQVAGADKRVVPPVSLFPCDIEYNNAFAALLQRDES